MVIDPSRITPIASTVLPLCQLFQLMVSVSSSCWVANRRPIMESVSTCTKDGYPISLWLEDPRKQDVNRRNVATSNLEIMG